MSYLEEAIAKTDSNIWIVKEQEPVGGVAPTGIYYRKILYFDPLTGNQVDFVPLSKLEYEKYHEWERARLARLGKEIPE